MTKPGPKRQDRARYPSGKPREVRLDPTPELLNQRRVLLGKPDAPDDVVKTQNLGKGLGVLYERADITLAMWSAGERLRSSWLKYLRLIEAPPRTAKITRLLVKTDTEGYDPAQAKTLDENPDDDIRKAKASLDDKLSICLQASKCDLRETRAILETLCIADQVPPKVYQYGDVPDRIRECIRLSLGALARHLKIEDRA